MKMKKLFAFILSAAMFSGIAQDQQPAAKRCKGQTVKNEQCKMRAAKDSDYCKIHNPDAPRCGMPTSKGQPCKRQVKTKGDHCFQHAAAQ